jgi:hypothetical protein
MVETALATPFDSDEIVEIACAEFKKRLRGLSPLYSGKQYNAFSLDFNIPIRLVRASGESSNTLAWGNASKGVIAPEDPVECENVTETFTSKEPNVERMERDMPLTVEDKKGGLPKKVRVKDMKKK